MTCSGRQSKTPQTSLSAQTASTPPYAAALSPVRVGGWRWLCFSHVNDTDWIEMEEQIAFEGPFGAFLQMKRTRRYSIIKLHLYLMISADCAVYSALRTDNLKAVFNKETLTKYV